MAIEPVNQNQTTPQPPQEPSNPAFQTMGSPIIEKNVDFGPDYVIDKALEPKEIPMGVPFAPVTAAQTLAALPPIHPLGTASLTVLRLQKMMEPLRKPK